MPKGDKAADKRRRGREEEGGGVGAAGREDRAREGWEWGLLMFL